MTGRFPAQRRGAAAVEFALWVGILIVPLLNVLDLGYYAFQAMQVRQAAQAAVASTIPCATTLPAVTGDCRSTLSNTITTAARSTSLGSAVEVSSAFEGFFCSNTDGKLKAATDASGANPWPIADGSTPAERPNSCSATTDGRNTNAVGDYVAVTTTYSFHPLFPGVTVASLLPATITHQAWMRLG